LPNNSAKSADLTKINLAPLSFPIFCAAPSSSGPNGFGMAGETPKPSRRGNQVVAQNFPSHPGSAHPLSIVCELNCGTDDPKWITAK
jgi:hypothetical protein